MRVSNRVIPVVCFTLLSLVLTARLSAVDNNTACNPAGGCWSPCSSAGDGSSQTIGASQIPECSPKAMSNCSGNSQAVCGVHYSYDSANCDVTTISNSSYSYSSCCSS
jgi:hypothetical protein